MFKFHEGQTVAIRKDRPALGLKAGDIGMVWALYAVDPPAYEVTFRSSDGGSLDVTMTEEVLLKVGPVTPKAARKSGKRPVEAA